VYWEEFLSDLSQYPDICVERVKETTKDSFQHFPSSGRNLNQGPTEEGAEIVPVQPECSVKGMYLMK
jgi:hypothetical protein